MANNIVLNAGSGGSTLATEQNGTAEQYQLIKLIDGTSGAFTNRLTITSGGAAKVDGSGVVQPISDNGANLHVQGAAASGAAKAGNPVQAGGVFNTTQPTVTNGQAVELQASARGGLIVATGADTFNVTVNAALPTGSNTIGAVTQASGPWTDNLTQVGSTNVLTTGITAGVLAVTQVPSSGQANALSTYRALLAASNNAAAVKGSAGVVYGLQIFTVRSTPFYVKLYNKATAPAPATDNSLLIKTIQCPANATAANGAGVVINFGDSGIGGFSSGIGIAVVTGISDTDNTSTAASDGLVNLDYK